MRKWLPSAVIVSLFATSAAALPPTGAQRAYRPAGAERTALTKPVSPLSPPVSAIRGDRRLPETMPPPRDNVWERIQEPLDRSFGRIEDRSTYEVRRIERRRDERLGRVEPRREFDRFQEQHERELRLEEARRRQLQLEDPQRARRRELDRREYMIYLGAGSSPLAGQVEQDRRALEAARAERDRALYEAAVELDQATAQPGADRAALQRQYEQARREIRQQYEQTRARILGY